MDRSYIAFGETIQIQILLQCIGSLVKTFTLLGILTGSISFADLSVSIGGAVITYGNFIQAVLNFIVMAFVVFCLVKGINKLHRKKEEAPAAPPAPPEPSAEEKLLTEIRDLLKEKQ